VDFRGLLVALAEAEVDFIVVGGVAAVLHGAPATTFDLDLVHSRAPGSCRQLSEVLQRLEACCREHLPSRSLAPKEEDLRGPGQHLLMTSAGPLDLLGQVVGERGYEELAPRSTWLELGPGLRVRLLDLEALIELKRELGREKDRAQVLLLRRTLEERRGERS
jgi:hypothetical protein